MELGLRGNGEADDGSSSMAQSGDATSEARLSL
jgi:hypothetical protein